MKQIVIQGENKKWVREKKCSKSDLLQIWLVTPLHFGPLKFSYVLKFDTQGI